MWQTILGKFLTRNSVIKVSATKVINPFLHTFAPRSIENSSALGLVVCKMKEELEEQRS